MTNPARLDVVAPVFNEAEIVPELVRRLAASLDALPDLHWRVTLVNDGSSDATQALLEAAALADPRVRWVELARNFGHQPALAAGLALADGDAVVLLDGDLQDPPELIGDLVRAWREGAEVVIAERRTRAEHGLRRLGFDLFHAVFHRLVDLPILPNTGTYCLLSRPAAEALRDLGETHRFLPGMRTWVGFRQVTIPYDRVDRHAGAPKQTFVRLARYALDGLLSFSRAPLRVLALLGVCVAGVGFALGMYFAAKRLAGLEPAPTGFTTLVTLVLLLGGLQLFVLGLIGEYLGRIFEQVKGRPLFVVRRRSDGTPR